MKKSAKPMWRGNKPTPFISHFNPAVSSPQALVPVTIEVEVPFELHRYIIGQKGSGIRKMMDEFEVSVSQILYWKKG